MAKIQSYTCEVQGVGESAWVSNGLRFVTSEEAEKYGKDLYSRWMGMQAYRIAESTDKVTHLLIDYTMMTIDSYEAVRYACRAIVNNHTEKALNYAVEYARYALQLEDGHELDIQCRYVVNNVSSWRGDTAKQVRAILKAYTSKK